MTFTRDGYVAGKDSAQLKRAGQVTALAVHYIVSILICFAGIALAQTGIDQGQAERARQFLNRFADSSCINNQQCRSWMTENHLSVDDVISTLNEVERLAADTQRMQGNVSDLENEKRQLQQEDDSLREQITEKALDVLRSHNFGLNGANATEVLGNQLADQSARLQVGTTDIIITLFGYFEYEHELDLSTGAKALHLKFHPFVLGHGGTLGQEIDAYNKDAQLSLHPQLSIPDESILMKPDDQNEQKLDLSGPLEWSWDVRQSWFSSVRESDADISISIRSADHSVTPSLPVKVKGRPWWWPVQWLWEKRAELWLAFLVTIVFIVKWVRKDFRQALLWLWKLILHIVGKMEA